MTEVTDSINPVLKYYLECQLDSLPVEANAYTDDLWLGYWCAYHQFRKPPESEVSTEFLDGWLQGVRKRLEESEF